MSILDHAYKNEIYFKFVGLFRRDKLCCKKEYPWRSTDFSMDGEIPTIFKFSNLKVTKKINRKASALAILMDDFQFDQCKSAKMYGFGTIERTIHLRRRDKVLGKLYALQTTLIVLENNPKKLEKFLEQNLEAVNKAFEYEESIEELNKILDSHNVMTEVKPDLNLERSN